MRTPLVVDSSVAGGRQGTNLERVGRSTSAGPLGHADPRIAAAVFDGGGVRRSA